MSPDDGMGAIPCRIDLSQPSSARVYDYFLGGAHNFEIDRLAAAEMANRHPAVGLRMRANRGFLRRVVSYLISVGIDQFLDLGSGIPTVGNVHQIAQRLNPEAVVVYVDIEPMAVVHSRTLLADDKWAYAVSADLRRPDEVFATTEVRDNLELDRPLAVILASVLQNVPDSDDPVGIVAGYRDRLAPGSYLAISYPTVDPPDAGASDPAAAIRPRGACVPRTRDQFAAFFAGLELVEPGIVPMSRWRPEDGHDVSLDDDLAGLAGVGRWNGKPRAA